MRRTGKSNAVADDIGTVRLDRPDVRGGYLCSTSPIDKLEPGDCAAFIIGAQDDAPENAVSYDPRRDKADP